MYGMTPEGLAGTQTEQDVTGTIQIDLQLETLICPFVYVLRPSAK